MIISGLLRVGEHAEPVVKLGNVLFQENGNIIACPHANKLHVNTAGDCHFCMNLGQIVILTYK